MSVELGKFDLSRLPVDWSQVDPEQVMRATEAIQATTVEQCKELQETMASRNGDERGDVQRPANATD